MNLAWEFRVRLPRTWKVHRCGEVWRYLTGRGVFLGCVVKRLDGRYETIPIRRGKPPFTSKTEAKAFVEKKAGSPAQKTR